MLGFKIDESMVGWTLLCDTTDDFRFDVTWGGSLVQFLKTGEAPLEGYVTWSDRRYRCHGFISIDYLNGTITYSFSFCDEYGTNYRYDGKKSGIKPWNLLWTHTTCFGTIVVEETGMLVTSGVTHFKLSSIPRFLASLRFYSL